MKKALNKILIFSILLILPGLAIFTSADIAPAIAANWKTSTPEAQSIDSSLMAEMLDYIPDNNYGVHSVLVVRNGYLVVENNYYPYDLEQVHLLNSVTKNITSALIGLALEQGYLESLDEKVIDYFPDLEIENLDQRKKNITIKDLLTMKSGLEWSESGFSDMSSYEGMLNSENTLSYILNAPMQSEPGNYFNYSSGNSHLLSAIITRATGVSTLEFAEKYLFEPLGISEVYWHEDPQGYNYGGTRLYLKPRDLARFGHLYLREGRWQGEQIIPENWIEESLKLRAGNQSPGYGYHWWINDFGGLFTEAREGFSGDGFGGQYMFFVPELDLMVVFLSGLKVGERLHTVFERKILPAITEEPLPEDEPAFNLLEETRQKYIQAPSPSEAIELPKLAEEISGQKYVMDDGDTYTFDFSDNGKTNISWKPNQGEMIELEISLDQRYIKNKLENHFYGELDSTVALRGEWENSDTFVVDFRPLEHSTSFEYIFTFTDEEIQHQRKVISSERIYHESSGNLE